MELSSSQGQFSLVCRKIEFGDKFKPNTLGTKTNTYGRNQNATNKENIGSIKNQENEKIPKLFGFYKRPNTNISSKSSDRRLIRHKFHVKVI